jgi:glutamyl-tRNA synthetase
VDDLEMRIDHVVRGADLLSSTARQILVARALEAEPPSYLHAPLVLGADGARLAKRSHGVPLRDHRERRSPREMLGLLAHAIGISDDDAPRSATELLPMYDTARLSLAPVCAPGSLLGPT